VANPQLTKGLFQVREFQVLAMGCTVLTVFHISMHHPLL